MHASHPPRVAATAEMQGGCSIALALARLWPRSLNVSRSREHPTKLSSRAGSDPEVTKALGSRLRGNDRLLVTPRRRESVRAGRARTPDCRGQERQRNDNRNFPQAIAGLTAAASPLAVATSALRAREPRLAFSTPAAACARSLQPVNVALDDLSKTPFTPWVCARLTTSHPHRAGALRTKMGQPQTQGAAHEPVVTSSATEPPSVKLSGSTALAGHITSADVCHQGPGQVPAAFARGRASRESAVAFVGAAEKVLLDDRMSVIRAHSSQTTALPAFELAGPRNKVFFDPAHGALRHRHLRRPVPGHQQRRARPRARARATATGSSASSDFATATKG